MSSFGPTGAWKGAEWFYIRTWDVSSGIGRRHGKKIVRTEAAMGCGTEETLRCVIYSKVS